MSSRRDDWSGQYFKGGFFGSNDQKHTLLKHEWKERTLTDTGDFNRSGDGEVMRRGGAASFLRLPPLEKERENKRMDTR